MPTVVITGANRGIGLELCRQMAARGDDVRAVCRRASDELRALDVAIHEGVDVTDDAALARLAQALGTERIDTLVNNAGILSRQSLDDLDTAAIRAQFEVNALAPLRVTRALLPALHEGAKVAIVTSRMGSIGDNTSGGHYGYRMSKAAANIAGASLACDLRERGIAVILLHPGMVATQMTGGRGIPAEEAARGLIARIVELSLENTGAFRHANGEPLPW